MTAFGAVLRDAVPMVQAAPEMGVLVGEVLQFVVRTFKGGRQLENVLETTIAKMNEPKPPMPPPPDPEQIKAEAAMQLEQAKQSAMAQTEQFKAQFSGQLEQAKMQHELQMEQMKQEAETNRTQMKAMIDRETKLQIAAMNAQAAEKPTVQIDAGGEMGKIGQELKGMAEQSGAAMTETMGQFAQAAAMLADAVQKMNKPKKRVLQRGDDGRAIGMIEIED